MHSYMFVYKNIKGTTLVDHRDLLLIHLNCVLLLLLLFFFFETVLYVA